MAAIEALVPLTASDAIAAAFNAATAAGKVVHPAFGPQRSESRNVTAGEEGMAQSIANHLDQFAVEIIPIHLPQQPEQEQPDLHAAATWYRTITVSKTGVEAATIAASGHVASVANYFNTHANLFNWETVADANQASTNARALLISLATPAGTVQIPAGP